MPITQNINVNLLNFFMFQYFKTMSATPAGNKFEYDIIFLQSRIIITMNNAYLA